MSPVHRSKKQMCIGSTWRQSSNNYVKCLIYYLKLVFIEILKNIVVGMDSDIFKALWVVMF